MPLELYLRGKTWWFKGQIEELPKSDYNRQSTKKTKRQHAEVVLAKFRNDEIKAHYTDAETSFLFAEAVMLYDPSPEFADHLLKVMPYLEQLQVKSL